MASITGKYELLSDPNDPDYEACLRAFGVSAAHIEAGQMVRPSLEISLSGDVYTIKTLSELKNTEISFRLGNEFREATWDDRISATTFSSGENGGLVQIQQIEGRRMQIVREFRDEGMTETYTTSGMTAVRKYKRS